MQIRQLKSLKQSISRFDLRSFVSPSAKTRHTRYIHENCYKISAVVQRPHSDIVELTRDADLNRFRFLESMKNHIIRPKNIVPANDSEHIINIYSKVIKPTAYHFDIVRRANDSFETISKVFDLAQDEKSLEFVRNVQYDVLDGSPESLKVILDMLNSPNREKYIENLNDYVSYLKLNVKNENAIKTLDKLSSEGKYNRTKYDNKLSTKDLMKDRILSAVLEGKFPAIEKGFSKENAGFIKLLIKNFVKDKKTPNADTQKELINIYKSLNPQNIDIRTSILRQFRSNAKLQEENDLRELSELYRRIDADENIRSFVQKVVSKGIGTRSVGELNRIIEVAPLRKATVFFNNLRRIVATSTGEERINALRNELENPFFVPQHKVKQTGMYNGSDEYGFLSKMLKIVENEIDKFRYRRMLNAQAAKQNNPTADVLVKKIKFVRPKLSNKEYKIRLSEEVNNQIKKILGEKTYAKQQGVYVENVTRMRLQMLPYIFDAIKTEASEARKLGKPVTIRNSNAVNIYKRINGRNRKLIRYMLKQTNENGTKTFSYGDIIRLIDKKENEIANIRKINPEFKYADTKLIYADEYNELINKYGKLRKTTKNKTA